MKSPSMSIYVDRELFKEFLELVKAKERKSASARITELIRTDVARLRGVEAPDTTNYDALKSKYKRIANDFESLTNHLMKLKVYKNLFDLAKGLGLDTKTYGNIDEVIPKLLNDWKGQRYHAFLFANLMELVGEKRQLEQQLAEFWESRAKNR